MKYALVVSIACFGLGWFLFTKSIEDRGPARAPRPQVHKKMHNMGLQLGEAAGGKSNTQAVSPGQPLWRRPTMADRQREMSEFKKLDTEKLLAETHRFMDKLRSSKWQKRGELNRIGDVEFKKSELEYLMFQPVGDGVAFEMEFDAIKKRFESKSAFGLVLPDRAVRIQPAFVRNLSDGTIEFQGQIIGGSELERGVFLFKQNRLRSGQIALGGGTHFEIQAAQNWVFLTKPN